MNLTLAFIGYGLLVNAGLFMTFFWGRIAYRRLKTLNWRMTLKDRYALIATCLTLSSVGTSIYFGTRIYRYIVEGLFVVDESPTSSYLLLLGLFTIGCAKAGFVWAVNCDPKSWIWRSFIGLSIFWTALAVVLDLL